MRVIFIKKQNLINAAILAIIAIVALVAGVVGGGVATASAPISSGTKSENSVALMFNVCGGEEYLDDILKTLKDNEVKATFFVSGVWALKQTPDFLKIAEAKHEIGNHGFFHQNQKKMSQTQNWNEITLCHQMIKQTCGIDMTLFTPPSRKLSKATSKAAASLGYKTIMPNRNSCDDDGCDANTIFKNATKKTKAGDIVLMHPTQTSAQVLNQIIETLKEKGLNIVTVSEIIK